MKFTLIVKPEAESDIEEAAAIYRNQHKGLGEDFLNATRESIQRIHKNPHLYAVVRDDIRAAQLRRFPYVVYYQVQEHRIAVLGVFHGRRNPNIWQSRIDDES